MLLTLLTAIGLGSSVGPHMTPNERSLLHLLGTERALVSHLLVRVHLLHMTLHLALRKHLITHSAWDYLEVLRMVVHMALESFLANNLFATLCAHKHFSLFCVNLLHVTSKPVVGEELVITFIAGKLF